MRRRRYQVTKKPRKRKYDPGKVLPREVIEKILSEAASRGKEEMG